MSAHLTPDELMAAAETAPGPGAAQHLAQCDACRQEADAWRAVLAELREADVPEPSPLFWERFSARVTEAVQDRGVVSSARGVSAFTGWRAWTGWAWTLGGATVTAALLAVAFLPRTATAPANRSAVVTAEAPAPEPAVPEPAAPDLADGEDWALVAGAVDALDYDEVRAIGAPAWTGAAELAVQDLDADEQRELVRILQEELARARQTSRAAETL